jgi:polyferredoxin
VAWRFAPGLVLLVAVAFLVPLTTHRQVYCHHLCPHGAIQQLIKNTVPGRGRPTSWLPRWLSRTLSLVPVGLLVWVVIVALCQLPFNLAAIEPFDAYVWRVAGWATVAIALVGLAFSLLVPMAYCRFGCPTGAVLNYLRLQGAGDRFSRRDAAAVALLGLAIGLRLLTF